MTSKPASRLKPGSKLALVTIVSGDEASRTYYSRILNRGGYIVESFSTAHSAASWPGLAHADCIVADSGAPFADSTELLRVISLTRVKTSVVVVTGRCDAETASRCLRTGAFRVLAKPFQDELFLEVVFRAVQASAEERINADLKRRLAMCGTEDDGRFGMIGRSAPMQALLGRIAGLGPSDSPVLVVGEPGSGKGLAARAIHSSSPRASAPLVLVEACSVDCSRLESDLLGRAEAALSARCPDPKTKTRPSRCVTLLLDDADRLDEDARDILLRLMETRPAQLVASGKNVRIDARILATAQRDLRTGAQPTSRRAEAFPPALEIPPLRTRPGDIPLLAAHFTARSARASGMATPRIPARSMSEMISYPWPGNVRELMSVVERMVSGSREGVTGAFIP